VNPSTAFATVFTDELARCGVREAVLAPGSRSTPLAMAFHALDAAGRVRLHVRIDERAAAFTALGLAKASRLPVAIVCTSGTAAANFHPAVIEASQAGVPLLVLTADRPPELRDAGASQTIDQVKLYGEAVRWYADPAAPQRRAGAAAAWRSLACQAHALASGSAGTFPGPVHVNLPFREPLVPDDRAGWPESLDGRPGGQPWTRHPARAPLASAAPGGAELAWTERGVVVCGDGDYDPAPLLAIAEQAGWPVLAEPSSNARRGPNALTAYQYLLSSPGFMAAHAPDVIISAGRPGLSRPQSALLRTPGARHVVIAQGPGRWADQARMATDVVAAVSLTSSTVPGAAQAPRAPATAWLAGWLRADAAARAAVDAILDEELPSRGGWPPGTPRGMADGPDGPDGKARVPGMLSEPRLARDLVSGLPGGALLWVGSSMPVRDVDSVMRPRADVRFLASRGASGIDGTTSSAIGAALAHQAPGGPGGPAFALIGDLSFVHDAAGLALGPREPRPDLCLIVVNNDGGGIFSTLEQAAFESSFERLFGTSHGADLSLLAAALGVPYACAQTPDDLAKAMADPGSGLRIVEVRTDRGAQAALRTRIREAALGALG
jgi:2-succinyl-5-enolpyruvyl-6-hydroxy-3-cyclohexene-1-carboxylate synthase